MKINIRNHIFKKKGIELVTEKIQNKILIKKKRLLNEEKKKKNIPKPKRKFTKKEQNFIDGLKQALLEVKLHQEGKIKLPSLQEFLEELRTEN